MNHEQNIQYHSVPSSPMNQNNNPNQSSVFQFNPNLVAQQLKESVLPNPSVHKFTNTDNNVNSNLSCKETIKYQKVNT